ncbi:Sodium/glutamate symporter [Ruminococcaceae bacterium BL-6]|nr:Sodium/glutamate symporter [Ruminococcaceae bacterium BL-6]
MDLWDVFVDVSWIGILIVIAQFLRATIPLFQKFFIPASLLAGILAFIFGPNGVGWIPFSSQLSTYAAVLVAVVFAAAPIGDNEKAEKTDKKSSERSKMMWGMTVNTMGIAVVQYAVGILLTMYVLRIFYPKLHEGFGLMMATAFFGGPGTSAAVGGALQKIGWADGTVVGYTFCSVGIILGIILGIVIINWGARKGYTNYVTSPKDLPRELLTGLIPPENQKKGGRITISSISVDTLSFHLAIVLLASYLGYLCTELIEKWTGFEIPVFCTALIFGYLVQFVLKASKTSKYVDRSTITRISGTATDFLIVSALGSIKISIVIKYGVPMLVTVAAVLILNWLWFILIGGHTSPRDWFERDLMVWGQANGVLATGILLERVVDPEQKAYAVEDTGFANLISRPIITFLTVAPPIFIGLFPVVSSYIFGWGSLLVTAIILLIGYKFKWYTPGGPLPKGRAKLNLGQQEKDEAAAK